MTSIKKQRLSLGVTQQELADYLDISRSHLAMAEGGHRELPLTAQAKLSALRRNMTGDASVFINAEMQRQNEKARNMLHALAQDYNRRSAAILYKLEKIRSRHRQYLKVLQSVSGVLTELPPGRENKKDRLWLELLQTQARHKMDGCGIGAQVLLQLRAEVFADHAQRAQLRLL